MPMTPLLQEAYLPSGLGETTSPGYFPNASKTWLITKESFLAKAKEIFNDAQINITSQGRPHLGAPLGIQDFVDQFTSEKINQWKEELRLLMEIARSQPHAACTAYTHRFVHKVSYLCRTVPNIKHSLQSLEDYIRSQLIPTLTGQSSPCNSVRDLLGLSARLGGLGLVNPIKISSEQHKASISITAPLKDQILSQDCEYSLDCIDTQVKAKQEAQKLPRDTSQGSRNYS